MTMMIFSTCFSKYRLKMRKRPGNCRREMTFGLPGGRKKIPTFGPPEVKWLKNHFLMSLLKCFCDTIM